eukprot:c20716_g1_i1 orf=206-871(+)
MAALSRAWSWYLKHLTRNPVPTQMISSGLIWAVGDVTAQEIDFALETTYSHSSAVKDNDGEKGETRLDWKRVATCSSFGLVFVGPIGHYWYRGLEYYVKQKLCFRPNSVKFIGSKVIADGFIFGPIDLLAFFSYMGFFSGRNFDQLKQDLKRDFIPAFMTEGALWPVIQVANFRFVPVRHQLLFVNAFCVVDSAFLSWFKHQDDAPWKLWLSSLVLPESEF